MNHEAQREAIGEHLGWKLLSNNQWVNPSGKYSDLPDYPNDLNAMFQAEMSLNCNHHTFQIGGVGKYMDELEKALGESIWSRWPTCHAGPSYRAEAFLQANGIWRDTT